MGKTSSSQTNPEPPVPHMDSKRRARVIGSNLRFLRKQRFPGWGGQKNFADFLGISPNDLCAYEYGRTSPSEFRLEDIAKRLGIASRTLMAPLPGVTPLPPGEPASAPEKDWRDQVDKLRQDMARLEGRNEILREQIAEREGHIQRLQEANYLLRDLLYADSTPEAAARRSKMLERISPSIAELIHKSEEF